MEMKKTTENEFKSQLGLLSRGSDLKSILLKSKT